VTTTATDDWSPADNPYAIAVSEARRWRDAARLAILRMRDSDDSRLSWFSSRQIDARLLVFALRQLLTAEQLEQVALEELGIDRAARDALAQARKRFEDALPGVKDMRDGLMHFEDWSRGEGRSGAQKKARDAGAALRDVARDYWGFGFDPNAGTVSFGPYVIHIDAAERAAKELCHAIHMAAREADKKNVAELRTKTIGTLMAADIACDCPDVVLKVSPGVDLKIWLSLDMHARCGASEYEDLAVRIVAALSAAGLRLASSMEPQSRDAAERLARGEPLYVAPDANGRKIT